MVFFRRELGPIERFEVALKDKLSARQKLAERLSATETDLVEKRAAPTISGSIAPNTACASSMNAPRSCGHSWLRRTTRSPRRSGR
jgi:hypothetical protein